MRDFSAGRRDRIHDDGVIAFITNRSFIESRTFDGFRKTVANEFNEIYVMDLGGDVRANPKLSGTKHNVFGIQTGVAISFFVKAPQTEGLQDILCATPGDGCGGRQAGVSWKQRHQQIV